MKAFPKNSSHQNEAYYAQQEKKIMRQEKRKKRGGEKAKSKSQDSHCCVTFKPKNYLKILLSAHARTSQADILHLDQKAVKSTTGKRVCGKF